MNKILLLNNDNIYTYDCKEKTVFQMGIIFIEMLKIMGYGEKNISKILEEDDLFDNIDI